MGSICAFRPRFLNFKFKWHFDTFENLAGPLLKQVIKKAHFFIPLDSP